MVHVYKHFCKYSFHRGNVLECQVCVSESSILEKAVNQVIHQFGQVFFILYFQSPGGCFHSIGHHDYGTLFSHGVRTGISEQGFIYFLVRVFVFE